MAEVRGDLRRGDQGVTGREQCQWEGCTSDALPKPAATGRVNEAEVDLFLCGHHAILLQRGASAHVSLSVKPTPARDARGN